MAGRKQMPMLRCEICGGEFKKRYEPSSANRFCSPECGHIADRKRTPEFQAWLRDEWNRGASLKSLVERSGLTKGVLMGLTYRDDGCLRRQRVSAEEMRARKLGQLPTSS